MPAEFELTMRLRNNLIKRRRLSLGKSPRQLAADAGISYSKMLEYEGLKANPVSTKTLTWKPSARALAYALGVLPEDLFPETVLDVVDPTIVREVKAADVRGLASARAVAELPNPYDVTVQNRINSELKEAMRRLTPEEQQVVAAKEIDGLTYKQIGKEYGRKWRGRALSANRIMQIYQKAMRKLRGNRGLVHAYGYEHAS